MLALGGTLQMLRNTGFLTVTNIFTRNGVQIGSALEMILMAIALADRFIMIREEKEKMQLQFLEAQQIIVKNLRESEQVLESRVLERTNELEIASKKLQLLIEKEREYSVGKSNFLAMLTHELKSPLATIELASENIQRNQNKQINELSLKHIQLAVRDMTVITERCLLADKLEQNHSIINVTTFPFDLLVRDELTQGKRLNSEDAMRLQFDVPSHFLVTSDELLSRIIVSNLIENALKYSPAKSIVLISAKLDTEKSGVLISILNDIGKIGKPDKSKVFEKYYRSENAQRLRGTGLGLWLVHGITKQLGGQINYVEHNEKVEFQLWLPQ